MNDLYLIGNGFDLAHGLKTSYNDFLLWYLKESLQICIAKELFEDQLITVRKGDYPRTGLKNYKTINEVLEDKEKGEFLIKYNHDFLKNLVENYRDYKWVDIEYEYYMALVEIYRGLEKANILRSDFHFSRVKTLNDCFELIKKKLVEYLLKIKISSCLKNKQFEEILFEETGIPETREREFFDGVFNEDRETTKEEKLFVCFNYTSTIELYLKHSFDENNLLYIHGEIDGSDNPIIFGYGDQMDPYYEKIEHLNNNEFLKNIKSFSYFKTDNFQRVIRFLEKGNFVVKILGHSCAVSDRILLNTIFEHKNCEAIKIFHYEKSPTENDYFEKIQEISRHFKASGKGDMRMKIVPFDKYSKMPQVKKD